MPESVFNLRLLIDAIVLLAYFFGIVAIGLWAGRRNRDLSEFALGGRSIPWWAVLASIIAAETSAATFLGTPAEGFKTRGFIYGQLRSEEHTSELQSRLHLVCRLLLEKKKKKNKL